jgi:hypothetical protein
MSRADGFLLAHRRHYTAQRSREMNRSFPRPAIASLIALAVGAAAASGCAPDNDVKPGAPQLTKFIILQNGYSMLAIDPSTMACAAAAVTGAACVAADNPDTAEIETPDAMCQQADTLDFCQCDGSDAANPVWACAPVAAVRGFASIFDRLLDPTTLAIGPATPPDLGSTTNVTAMATPGGAVDLLTDYASNGTPTNLVLPLFAVGYYMNFRLDGPSLFTVPVAPAFPSGATITVSLNGAEIRAKDGVTPFTGDGLLKDGVITFSTAPFSAAVNPVEIAADMTSLFVTFTNVVDPTAIEGHITVLSPTNTPLAIMTSAMDSATIVITPVDNWPEGKLTVIVDASTKDVLDEALGSTVTQMVTVKPVSTN